MDTGGGRPAIVDMPQPKVKLDHFQGTSGTYAGWDRFGRTRQQYWTGYSGTANVDRVYYDYDYASNRLYSDIDSAIHSGNNRDQVYTYDSAHRLKTFDQGTLSGSTITGTPTQEQDWSLDGLGNWSYYVTKTSGTTALNQDRTVNKVNEITDITESVRPAWVTPGYDAAGSMTTIPQPGNLTAGYTATYDAWHRLVKLAIGGTTVAEYEYDATKQRIAKKVYASGVLDYEHHYYYNDNWQVLETLPETEEAEELPVASYVWHPYYIDALLLRDYDEDADGIVVRYYYTQYVNFNVLSILSSTGTVLERYGYTPYGQAEVLTASFMADSDGLSDSKNDITFTGQRYDSEFRLMLYRHRYYHPVLGTFCSRDPIGYEGSQWSLYEYVSSNPAKKLDPFGLATKPLPCCGKTPYNPMSQGCCNNSSVFALGTECCENGRVASKVTITVCTGRLGVDDSWVPAIGYLSHTYIICPDGTRYGKQPTSDNLGPWLSEGQVVVETARDPTKAECEDKLFCPADARRMCRAGKTREPYNVLCLPFHGRNCHSWSAGNSE